MVKIVIVGTITAENPGEEEAELSVLFSFENLIGTGGSMAYETKNPDMKHDFIMNSWNPGFVWCDRRTNYETAEQLPEGDAIFFGTKEDHNDPASCGDYTMLCIPESGMTVSRQLGWDVFTDGKALWETFEKTGELEDRTVKKRVDDACIASGTWTDDTCTTCKTGSDDVYTAATMAVKGVLAAHEKKQVMPLLSADDIKALKARAKSYIPVRTEYWAKIIGPVRYQGGQLYPQC